MSQFTYNTTNWIMMQDDLQSDLRHIVQKVTPMQNTLQKSVQMRMQHLVQNDLQYVVQSSVQIAVQNSVQPQRGDLSIDGVAQIFFVAPAERPVNKMNRSLRWSYSKGRLAVIYKQVTPPELQRHADRRAVVRAESRAESHAELHASSRAVLRADLYAEHRAVVGAERFAEKICADADNFVDGESGNPVIEL